MFALNVRRFHFSDRKNRLLGLGSGLLIVIFVALTYFGLKNSGLKTGQSERMGLVFTRTLHTLVADARGLYVYGIKGELTPDGSGAIVSWKFLPGQNVNKNGSFEIYRSTMPIAARSDLEKADRVGTLPSTARRYTDNSILRSGEYYYAVVFRNPENQYPLISGKNTLFDSISVQSPLHEFQAVQKGKEVVLAWKIRVQDDKKTIPAGEPAPGQPLYKGAVNIYRSDAPITSPKQIAGRTPVAVVKAGTQTYADRPPGEGHYFYALIPAKGETLFLVGDTFTEKAVTIGEPAKQAALFREAGEKVTLSLANKNGIAAGDFPTADDPNEKVDRQSRVLVRKAIEPVVAAVRQRFPSWLRELTIFFGYDYFYSTDQQKNPLPGEKLQAGGTSPVVFSDIYNFSSKRTVEITIENWPPGQKEKKAALFLGGFSGDADRGYAAKLYTGQPDGKSVWGMLLLLLALSVLALLLFYIYDRFIGRLCIVFSLILLVGFSFITLKFVSSDIQSQIHKNQKELSGFINTITESVRTSDLYTDNQERLAASLFDNLGYNSFNEPDIQFSVSVADLQKGGPGVRLSEKWVEAERSGAFILLFIVFGISFLFFAVPILVMVTRGMGERFINAITNHRTAYLFTLPAIIILILLVFAPLVYTFILSTAEIPKQMHIVEMDFFRQFRGLANFGKLLGVFDLTSTSNFYWTLKTTILYTMFTVIFQTVIGIVMALVLNKPDLKFRTGFRTALILPWAIPTYVSALIFNYLFSSGSGGFVNQLLRVFGEQPVNWLYDVNSGLLVIILASVWYGFPFIMVVALGALQSIPEYLYESATIEGASNWQKFWAITIPMIQPAVMPAVILSTVWTFNNFNFVYLMNKGWEGTDILITRVYDYIDPAKTTIDYGLGAAFSTVIFVILIVYIYSLRKLTNFTEKSF